MVQNMMLKPQLMECPSPSVWDKITELLWKPGLHYLAFSVLFPIPVLVSDLREALLLHSLWDTHSMAMPWLSVCGNEPSESLGFSVPDSRSYFCSNSHCHDLHVWCTGLELWDSSKKSAWAAAAWGFWMKALTVPCQSTWKLWVLLQICNKVFQLRLKRKYWVISFLGLSQSPPCLFCVSLCWLICLHCRCQFLLGDGDIHRQMLRNACVKEMLDSFLLAKLKYHVLQPDPSSQRPFLIKKFLVSMWGLTRKRSLNSGL